MSLSQLQNQFILAQERIYEELRFQYQELYNNYHSVVAEKQLILRTNQIIKQQLANKNALMERERNDCKTRQLEIGRLLKYRQKYKRYKQQCKSQKHQIESLQLELKNNEKELNILRHKIKNIQRITDINRENKSRQQFQKIEELRRVEQQAYQDICMQLQKYKAYCQQLEGRIVKAESEKQLLKNSHQTTFEQTHRNLEKILEKVNQIQQQNNHLKSCHQSKCQEVAKYIQIVEELTEKYKQERKLRKELQYERSRRIMLEQQ